MKGFRVYLALVVVLLAILGAVLHPLSLLLNLAPVEARGFEAILQGIRSTIADLLGWGVLGLLLIMAAYVAVGRTVGRTHRSTLHDWFVEAHPPGPRASSIPGVVVAVTAYNDALATADCVRGFLKQPGVVKVLVIDNNSTDDTAELATAAGATVIAESRQGYGYACLRGLSEALAIPDTEVIVLTEGDGTFVAEDLPKFLAYTDHADLVVGNRVVKGLVANDSQMDHFFMWGNMAVAMLLRLRFWDGRFLGPAGLTDVGCTFRAIRRDALARIFPDLSVGGNHFSPHMLVVALANHLSVVEIPIRFRRRPGESKGASRSFTAGLRVGFEMIWHIMNFEPKSRPHRSGVVVERDGIIRHRPNDSTRVPVIEFIPGAPEGLAALSRRGHRVVIIGDRLDHDRVGAPWRVARAIDARIAAEVEHQGGHIAAFVMCPHAPNKNCGCRLPKAQLLQKAARRLPFDLMSAVIVSDKLTFLQAAATLGCKTIFVGAGAFDLSQGSIPVTRAEDLASAVGLVLNGGSGAGNGFSSHSTTMVMVDSQSKS